MKSYLNREIFSEQFLMIKVPSFLIIMLPIFFVTGSFLTDLAVSTCAILFLINTFKNKLFDYYKNKLFLILFFFNLVCILSSLVSNELLFSLKTSVFYFRFLIFSLCVWYILEKNSQILKQLFYSFCLIFLVLFIDSFYQYYFGVNILGYELVRNRVSSLFGDELVMGSYIARVLPVFLAISYYLIDTKLIKKNHTYLINFIFISSSILILLAGERTAFFLFLLSMFYIFVLNLKRFKSIIISILVILPLFIFFNPDSVNRIYHGTIKQVFNYKIKNNEIKIIELKQSLKEIKLFSQLHEDHYIVSYKIFRDNKFLGSGPKTFRIICKEPKYYVSKLACTAHPHGTYFQLLAETGIIGFSIISFLFFFLIWYSTKKIFKSSNSMFEVCLLSSFLITLWPIIPAGNFFNNWISSIYYFPIGFFMWYINLKQKN